MVGTVIGVIGVSVWMINNPPVKQLPSPPPTEQNGYFKSDQNDRVIAYVSERPLTESEARDVFDFVPITTGRLTRALIYTSDALPAPGDELTLAGSLQEALVVTATPPHDDWSWAFHMSPEGEISFEGQ